MAFVGNGGWSGGVNRPDMWGPVARYGMATVSTNKGHEGTSPDGSFILNGDETLIDYGRRAVHLSAVYSKQIIRDFYKKPIKSSFWLGCSSGGKQGLRELQQFPETFDGVISGAAARWWSHLAAHLVRINSFINSIGSEGYLTTTDYALIAKQVMDQCDELDGVKDKIITNSPSQHVFHQLKPQQCPRYGQIGHQQMASSSFFGLEPGSESSPDMRADGRPEGRVADYFTYAVLNKIEKQTLQVSSIQELEQLVKTADRTNPGSINASNADVSPFFKRGGKLLTYHGEHDATIPSGGTLWYWEQVRKAVGAKAADQSFQAYLGECG
ncbi:hypothetical protein OIV83_001176 [Microbotryomycetes sp. JL201]|nr:hypothetical protein OIV83_001176 [Microbotryomycetes sp. JL201]